MGHSGRNPGGMTCKAQPTTPLKPVSTNELLLTAFKAYHIHFYLSCQINRQYLQGVILCAMKHTKPKFKYLVTTMMYTSYLPECKTTLI